eukprot:TRINITY_DN965_c0_g1_i1.p1 TRINITY_DN965_c0_g1~~TRINITY_DN965_c0_g1_i1.p1  ORF type:complete len:170 (-),score=26.69 TRINITY_DN965_c0_g1_i1:72-581(-)
MRCLLGIIILLFTPTVLSLNFDHACFSVFGGSIVYELRFQTIDILTDTSFNVYGTLSGSLSPCFGLNEWPCFGSAFLSKNGTSGSDLLVLALHSQTLDATNCGSTDEIATIDLSLGSGLFNLWNQRTNFGNSGAINKIDCDSIGELRAATSFKALSPGDLDARGNRIKF